MKSNSILGIVFGNCGDDLLGEMTDVRASGSVPFGGRYRLIDFSLSNLVHADVSRVAVMTRSNYRSLMDHLESGKSWDLARQNGGLTIVPPRSLGGGMNDSKIGSVYSMLEYIERAPEEYVALCDADVVANLDIKDMLRRHVESEAEITLAYAHGAAPNGNGDIMKLTVGADGRITEVSLARAGEQCDFSLDVVLMRKTLLCELVMEAVSHNITVPETGIFIPMASRLRIVGYPVEGYWAVIDSLRSYVEANMRLLDPATRRQLFRRDRRIYTKVRNEMPAKYGLASHVSNSLISDGCIIEGRVENSILFRGVRVGQGAVVRNCILMQSTVIGDNAELDYVCTDKNVRVGEGRTLSGSEEYTVFIRKGSEV